MEPRKGQQNWLKRKLKTAKNYVRRKGDDGFLFEPSHAQSRTQNPVSEDVSVLNPNIVINQLTGITPPDTAAGSSSGNPTASQRISSDHVIDEHEASSEPSHSTTYHTQNDGHDSLYTPEPTSPTHAENNEAETEVATGNESADDSAELLGPNKLWAAAYKKLRDEDPDVLRAYQKLLLEKGLSRQTNEDEIPLRDGDWEEQVQKLAQERLQAVQEKRLRLQIGGRNIVVRDQLQKAMGFIVSTKDLVSAAISSEPHAAIAWASVMFIFPLLNKMLQQDKDAVEGFEYILSLLVRCKLMENDFLQPTAGDPNSSENHHKLALSLQSKTIELYSKVYKYQVRVILHLEHSTLTRHLRDLGVSDDWKGMIETLKATEREIKDDLQGLSNHTSKKIDEKFEDFRSKVDVFLEICKKTMENIKDIEQASHLGHLPVAHSAAFNSSEIERERYCTPGTQMKILNDLQQWLESPTGKPILWLHGMAGTGKSTIARTVAIALSKKAPFANSNRLLDNISLGATFFFKQDDARRNHAGVLFTTLAHQLAHKPLGLEGEIADAIKRNASPGIGARSLKVQWDELILKPLKALEEESLSFIRLVLIIDALDECQAKETGAIRINAQHIIQSLKQVEELSKVQVRLLITSRNESHIDRAFKNIPEKSYDEIELSKVSLNNHHDEKKDDITIYLESELLKIENNNGHNSKWPSADDIRKLVEKAGGLFIYAATTCKFLDVQPDLAKKRLHQVLEGRPNEKSPPFLLSQIYSTVLDFYTRDWTEDEKQEDHELKEILRLIVVLFKPLPICSLAKFTKSRISAPRVQECLENIRSVVDLPQDPKSPVSLVHLSFHEFLLDEKRCKKAGFLVEPTMVHIQLFERCLEIMSYHLHMDMCGLQKPGILSVEVQPGLVQQCIPPHLQYACRYWVGHLLQAREFQEAQDALVDHGRIHKFLRGYVLSWLETLSLAGELGSAVHMISHLKALVNARENRKLSKLLHDANRFILFNRRIIQEAPLQVYYSALLFSPTKSIIRSLFLNLLPEWVMKPPAVNEDWDAELMTLEGHKGPINSIAISPDSKMIVSGSSDGTARLWEADTGIETAKIDFRLTESIQSVAFSSDGQTIALSPFYSHSIMLYDVATGEISIPFDHLRNVRGMAFCPRPGSKMLATIASDRTLRLWDISTKQQICVHDIWEEQPTTIAFSPNGNLVAAGSGKYESGAVHIWGVETGELITKFNYQISVRSIAFSPDGVTMASATDKGLLEIRNIESGVTLASSYLGKQTWMPPKVAYAANGGILATGLADGTIQFRNPVSGEEIRELRNNVLAVSDIAFSSNGNFMASASDDHTIRLFDIAYSDETGVVEEDNIISITTSNGSDIAIVTGLDTTTVWDLNKFEAKLTIPCKLMQCTPDGKIGASCDEPGGIQIWDVTTGERIMHFEHVRDTPFWLNSEFLAFIVKDTIQILDIITWKEQAVFKIEGNSDFWEIILKISGKVVLWATDNPYPARLGNLETGDTFYRAEYRHGYPWPTLSPNGRLAAFQSDEGGKCVSLLQIDPPRVKGSLQLDGDGHVRQFLFSPDSTRIITVTARSDVKMEITLWDTNTGDKMQTLRMDSSFWVLAIALDGKVAYTVDDNVFVWNPVTGELSDRLIGSFVDGLSFSKDSNYLESRRGRLPLPSTIEDFGCLYVDDDWVLQGGERLLWLPKAYRPDIRNIVVRGGTIMLGLASKSVTFIKIDLEKTPLAMHRKASS
ncbi:hypothetical protein M434DRAFT_30643 [Hypoxylon sp. CO27-5]|nr:hypothetical protein M434DRAFT_30643 [Hypoxylon sp. CO27-5]